MKKFGVPPAKILLAEISRRVSHLTSTDYVDALAPIDDTAINLLDGEHKVTPQDILALLSASIQPAPEAAPEASQQPQPTQL
jgi:hypothetical protein